MNENKLIIENDKNEKVYVIYNMPDIHLQYVAYITTSNMSHNVLCIYYEEYMYICIISYYVIFYVIWYAYACI